MCVHTHIRAHCPLHSHPHHRLRQCFGICFEALNLPYRKMSEEREGVEGSRLQGVALPQCPARSKGLQLSNASPGLGRRRRRITANSFHFPAHSGLQRDPGVSMRMGQGSVNPSLTY